MKFLCGMSLIFMLQGASLEVAASAAVNAEDVAQGKTIWNVSIHYSEALFPKVHTSIGCATQLRALGKQAAAEISKKTASFEAAERSLQNGEGLDKALENYPFHNLKDAHCYFQGEETHQSGEEGDVAHLSLNRWSCPLSICFFVDLKDRNIQDRQQLEKRVEAPIEETGLQEGVLKNKGKPLIPGRDIFPTTYALLLESEAMEILLECLKSSKPSIFVPGSKRDSNRRFIDFLKMRPFFYRKGLKRTYQNIAVRFEHSGLFYQSASDEVNMYILTDGRNDLIKYSIVDIKFNNKPEYYSMSEYLCAFGSEETQALLDSSESVSSPRNPRSLFKKRPASPPVLITLPKSLSLMGATYDTLVSAFVRNIPEKCIEDIIKPGTPDEEAAAEERLRIVKKRWREEEEKAAAATTEQRLKAVRSHRNEVQQASSSTPEDSQVEGPTPAEPPSDPVSEEPPSPRNAPPLYPSNGDASGKMYGLQPPDAQPDALYLSGRAQDSISLRELSLLFEGQLRERLDKIGTQLKQKVREAFIKNLEANRQGGSRRALEGPSHILSLTGLDFSSELASMEAIHKTREKEYQAQAQDLLATITSLRRMHRKIIEDSNLERRRTIYALGRRYQEWQDVAVASAKAEQEAKDKVALQEAVQVARQEGLDEGLKKAAAAYGNAVLENQKMLPKRVQRELREEAQCSLAQELQKKEKELSAAITAEVIGPEIETHVMAMLAENERIVQEKNAIDQRNTELLQEISSLSQKVKTLEAALASQQQERVAQALHAEHMRDGLRPQLEKQAREVQTLQEENAALHQRFEALLQGREEEEETHREAVRALTARVAARDKHIGDLERASCTLLRTDDINKTLQETVQALEDDIKHLEAELGALRPEGERLKAALAMAQATGESLWQEKEQAEAALAHATAELERLTALHSLHVPDESRFSPPAVTHSPSAAAASPVEQRARGRAAPASGGHSSPSGEHQRSASTGRPLWNAATSLPPARNAKKQTSQKSG